MSSGSPPPKIRVKLTGTPCEVADCGRKAMAKMRCQSHAALHRRYGLTTEQMVGLSTACEACGSEERLHVDHCHASGAYRGVLCAACNTALGLLADDPARMLALIRYLAK